MRGEVMLRQAGVEPTQGLQAFRDWLGCDPCPLPGSVERRSTNELPPQHPHNTRPAP